MKNGFGLGERGIFQGPKKLTIWGRSFNTCRIFELKSYKIKHFNFQIMKPQSNKNVLHYIYCKFTTFDYNDFNLFS